MTDTPAVPDVPAVRAAADAVTAPDPATRDERNWAMACHLVSFAGYVIPFGNVIGPLLLWLLKREEWPLVDDQGKESLNFQITWTIFFFISIVLCFVAIGFLLLPVVILADLILVVIATIKASEGERYRYPLAIRFIS